MSKLSPSLKKITTRSKMIPRLAQSRPPGETIIVDAKREIAFDKLLLEGKSPATIAREMGVPRDRVHKWLNHKHEELKVSITESANIRREQLTALYDNLLTQYVPLALKDDLRVEGEKYGANGELKHIELEAWEAAKAAAEIVLKTANQMGNIWGLNRTNVSVDLPKGTNINFQNATAIFQIVRQAANQLEEPKQAQVIESEIIQ